MKKSLIPNLRPIKDIFCSPHPVPKEFPIKLNSILKIHQRKCRLQKESSLNNSNFSLPKLTKSTLKQS